MKKFESLDYRQCKRKRTDKNKCEVYNRRNQACKGYKSKKSNNMCHAHYLLYIQNKALEQEEKSTAADKTSSHLFKSIKK